MSPISLFLVIAFAFIVAVVDPAAAAVPSYNPTLSMDALQYSKAVKCPADLVANWTCGGPCDYHSSVTDVFVYDNATWTTQGFSGYDAASNRIVIAFRGSVTTLNWIEDFDFVLIDYPNKACSPDCKIHQGFHTAFDSLAQQVASDLKVLLNKHPNAELLLVTGHSLGGAIAHLAALAIAQAYPSLPMPLYLYTFGQPRVGNPSYAAWGSSLVRKTGGDKGIIYRMTHHQDPVPKLPPEWVGYLHSPIEVHYYDNTATNYRVCDDSTTQEDPKCCMGEVSLNGKDHDLYLGISADCN